MQLLKKIFLKIFTKYAPKNILKYFTDINDHVLFLVKSTIIKSNLYLVLDIINKDNFDYKILLKNYYFLGILTQIEDFLNGNPCFIIFRFKTQYLSNSSDLLFPNETPEYKDISIIYKASSFDRKALLITINAKFFCLAEAYTKLTFNVYAIIIEVRKLQPTEIDLEKEIRVK